jgi:hypothetical protein
MLVLMVRVYPEKAVCSGLELSADHRKCCTVLLNNHVAKIKFAARTAVASFKFCDCRVQAPMYTLRHHPPMPILQLPCSLLPASCVFILAAPWHQQLGAAASVAREEMFTTQR